MSGAGGALPTGAKLADYQIEGVLGEPGGFGVTYRARDIRLEREVAIKEYFPQAFAKRKRGGGVQARDAASEQVFGWGLERFVEEAQSLARFSHPNIVRVLRLIEGENGTAYIVMEMVRGETLEALVERDGPLSEAQFWPLFDQLLAGCDAIHGIGIIHRDIKPSNIIVRNNGEAVLIDFGAARDLALERRKGFTAAIVADGYSPPEQYSMKAQQDARSDIYALAATAYFAHTGEGPVPASARAGGDEMEPAASVAATLARPAYLKALDHALSLRADDRPRSIAEWRQALAPPAVVAEGGRRTLDRRGVLAIAGGATILAGVAAVLAVGRGGTEKAAIESKARPLKVSWVADIGAVAGMPFSAIAAAEQGAVLAGQQVGSGEQIEMMAIKMGDDGRVAARWSSGEAGSAGKAIWPMPDGGALVGGDFGGGAEAALIRLDGAWSMVSRQALGAGSVSCFLRGPSGLALGLEGGDGSGMAKLVFLDESGAPASEIRLIDQQTDSVQKAAFMDGGDIAVLGRRLRGDGKAGSQLWVARIRPDGEGVWRKQVSGLGITAGWALATAGEDIYVAGTTRAETDQDNPKRILVRFSGDGREIWSRIDDGAHASSGRALAVAAGRGRPSLYVGGSDDGPAYLGQLNGDGGLAWRSRPGRLLAGEELVTVESLSFRNASLGFASAYVQGSGGMKRLVAIGLIE